MRAAPASLCILGLLMGCERRGDQETAADPTINWKPVPPSLPTGARAAVVQGDPAKPGPFTMRLDMPDGYEIRPHHHPTPEVVRTLAGTLMWGSGKQWVDGSLEPLAPVSLVRFGAQQPHYLRAKGKTLVEVSGTGPFQINYENPADDPRNKPVQ